MNAEVHRHAAHWRRAYQVIMRQFFGYGKKVSSPLGAYTGLHFSYVSTSLSVVYCLSAAYTTINNGESSKWPISTNPWSTEAGEPGLTRGTCFVASRLELAAFTMIMCVFFKAAIRAGPAKKRIKVPKVKFRQPLQIWTWKLEALTAAQ